MEDWRIKCVFRVIFIEPLYIFFIFLFTYINLPILHFNKKKMISIYNNREKKLEDRANSILPILPILQRQIRGAVSIFTAHAATPRDHIRKNFLEIGCRGVFFIYIRRLCRKMGQTGQNYVFSGEVLAGWTTVTMAG